MSFELLPTDDDFPPVSPDFLPTDDDFPSVSPDIKIDTRGIDWGGDNRYDPKTGADTFDYKSLFDQFLNAAKSVSPFGRFLASAGIGALLNRANGGSGLFTPEKPPKVGFQGQVQPYTLTRQQTPYNTGIQNELLRLKQAGQDAMATGATQDQVRSAAFRRYGISPSQFDQAMQAQGTYRRPGQGGISYFQGAQYTAPSQALASGGIVSLADGGFVVPARVVSELGNGSTQAGIAALKQKIPGARALQGAGDGVSDHIPARMADGGEARVADGEAYIPPESVAKIGGGDTKRGAQKLYAMLDRVEKVAKSAKRGKDGKARKYIPA